MSAQRLSASDALIWRIEGDPVLRSPILVVGSLDRAPAWERLRAEFDAAAAAVPRLRQRLVPGPLGGRPAWVDDPGFAVDHHLRRVRVPQADGIRSVLDLVEPDVMTAFDPARPLWQLTLVEGLEGGRAAFALRFHHTITDGVGAIALAEHLFSTRRAGDDGDDNDDGDAVPAPPLVRPATPLVTRVADGLNGAIRAAVDPAGTARAGWRAARSVARILAPATRPLSPILVGRGLDRRLHAVELPLRGLQDAAHAVDGTVNDVFLAAVAGGLRAYHDALGAPADAVRVTMPVSVRHEGDEPGGNRFTPVRFVLPIDDPDAGHRTELAGAIVRRWRSEPAVALTSVLATLLDRLPAPVVRKAFAGMLRSIDVDAVDVPGLRRQPFLAGALVERLWAFAPPTGAAMSITLVSHADTACVGIAADRAAVTDPELLARCIEQGFDEVLALGRHDLVSGVPS